VETFAHLSAQHLSWAVYPQLTKEQFAAAQALNISPIQAQLLANRGVTEPEQMRAFIDAAYERTPDPYGLIDMPKAVERIRQALENKEHITVYGDFDADGVTSSALLFRALHALKHPDAILDYHIPHRLRDGCGLNLPALDRLKERGTSLIVTTDCASSDVEQVEYARKLSIDIIITDHHHPPAQLPAAHAMINPWRPDCQYGERILCGVGIAFKLTQALYRAYKRPQEEEIALLDLVAIGTVADIAPLVGENHTLVRLGMQQLNMTRKPGLLALIRSANLQPGRIRERDIAFAIAPRINAAGRMQDAGIAFALLTTDSEQEAAAYVEQLEQLNLSRQQQTELLMHSVREQAQNQSDQRVVLVMGDDWHEGILGLVAGRLSEEIDKPVLVLSNDRVTKRSRGSARSRRGYNIIAALRDFAQNLERYGGHTQAAGFTIQSERIEALRRHLLDWQDSGEISTPTALIDSDTEPMPSEIIQPVAEVQRMADLTITRWDKLTYDTYRQIRLLAPFGAGNPEPIFKMEGLYLHHARLSGKEGQHIQFWLGAPYLSSSQPRRQGTLFRGAARLKEFASVKNVTIIFRLEASEEEGKQDVWLRILDIYPERAGNHQSRSAH
jgi:single-stranded-DNA-specific exonuclease